MYLCDALWDLWDMSIWSYLIISHQIWFHILIPFISLLISSNPKSNYTGLDVYIQCLHTPCSLINVCVYSFSGSPFDPAVIPCTPGFLCHGQKRKTQANLCIAWSGAWHLKKLMILQRKNSSVLTLPSWCSTSNEEMPFTSFWKLLVFHTHYRHLTRTSKPLRKGVRITQ